MVPAQVILDPSGDQYTVMFDTGSQITLITKDCAMRLGAKEIIIIIIIINHLFFLTLYNVYRCINKGYDNI